MGFRGPVLQGIKHIVLKQLLIRDPHFHRLPSRTMLPIPVKTNPEEIGPSLLPATLIQPARPPSWSLLLYILYHFPGWWPYQFLTRGMSRARRVRPERRLKGRGAQSRAMPLAVLSVYRGVSFRKGSTNSGSSNSSSSSGNGSWL